MRLWRLGLSFDFVTFFRLHLLDRIEKRLINSVVPGLCVNLHPLPHRRNFASLSIFYKYFYGQCFADLHHSSLSFVTLDFPPICIIWLFSFLLVIRIFTHLAFYLVLLGTGTLFHVVAFPVSMIFGLLSVMLTVIFLFLCNSIFFLVAFCLVVASALQEASHSKKGR